MPPECPYCHTPATLVTGDKIYGPARFWDQFFWRCPNWPVCDAYVGTHKESKHHKPLGTMANKELRAARIQTHALFDLLWRDGKRKRKTAYKLLSDRMGLSPEETHIGSFDLSQCQIAINTLNAYLQGPVS